MEHGYSSGSILSESYLMNTNMTGFRSGFQKCEILVLWTKVSSALEGLKIVVWIYGTFDDNFEAKNGVPKKIE